MKKSFRNRTQAGQLLAQKLTAYANCPDVIVLGLPRGGIPVAFEVAKALQVPLDICLVRKLGVPEQPELAMGAIGMGDVTVLNEEVVQELGIDEAAIAHVTAQEQQELERRDQTYRGNRLLPQIKQRTVILVDDGIATGATLRAAIATLRQQQPDKIIVAVPIAPPTVCQALKAEVDEVVCFIAPEDLNSISHWYEDFSQTSDEEVCHLLRVTPMSTEVPPS